MYYKFLLIIAFFMQSAILFPYSGVHAETSVLKAAGFIDVRAGKIIRPATIVIEDERIAAINPDMIPDNVKLVELGDQIILPGLLDMHTHLAFDTTSPDWTTKPARWTAAEFALFGANAAGRALMSGVTTVRDVSSWRHFPDVALGKAIERGWIEGPRIVPAGHALSITGGHCDITGFIPGVLEGRPEYGVADGPQEIMKAIRYQIKHGVKVIKICATAGVASFSSSAETQQYTEEEIRAAVEEAARHGIRVASHAHGTAGIIASVRAGVASIEHGSMLTPEAVALMKKHGTYLVPTIYLKDREDREWPEELREKAEQLNLHVEASFQLALTKGVKIAMGSDLDGVAQGDNVRELTSMVRRGMSPTDAVRVATINGADLLGVDDRGEIKEGLLADLIAVDGNPLEDIAVLLDIKFVMKGGKIYKREE